MDAGAARSALVRAGTLEVEGSASPFRVSRIRRLPSRGFFRLIIPRVVVSVRVRDTGCSVYVRPDGIAWLVLVILAGGIFVELFTDRATHPRNYPPELVFVSTALYCAFLVLEAVRSHAAVRRALSAVRA